ncbi:hypothetical protein [Piscirickettsia salmonis]|uniref:hypothetical protein n=1 Tax=Piscirickettsia salmonis TaxID=1238 RepID=UPI0007D82379|nr:hypothetical protein A0O36_02695 [Piscirickettsiaceae bacterium NZ-RLO1]
MARILVIHYGISGSAAKKQAIYHISAPTYDSYLGKGVSYVRGCLNTLEKRPVKLEIKNGKCNNIACNYEVKFL